MSNCIDPGDDYRIERRHGGVRVHYIVVVVRFLDTKAEEKVRHCPHSTHYT